MKNMAEFVRVSKQKGNSYYLRSIAANRRNHLCGFVIEGTGKLLVTHRNLRNVCDI